jgi:hypothetical protein
MLRGLSVEPILGNGRSLYVTGCAMKPTQSERKVSGLIVLSVLARSRLRKISAVGRTVGCVSA